MIFAKEDAIVQEITNEKETLQWIIKIRLI